MAEQHCKRIQSREVLPASSYCSRFHWNIEAQFNRIDHPDDVIIDEVLKEIFGE